MSRLRLRTTASLLFVSGLCALVYQVTWLRELRHVFGASTAAQAAVLAIFMGGLGAGGVLLGKRADAHPRPLALYGALELLVAASAAVTPLLVGLARAAYVKLGGTAALGMALGTGVRLLLALLVLGVPTVLMGGTLPAAARAAASAGDAGRRRVAALYGANTLGAVTGAVLTTFVLLEVFGARLTLFMACLLNALVGVIARRASRAASFAREDDLVASVAPDPCPPAPARFVLAAAGVVGFAFLLMELVFYRMLAPLLGGSSYTFGLILAVALFGIGAGGAAYAIFAGERPATLSGFACTAALEALCIAVPYALGDRIAILALLLRPLGTVGFYGHVVAWTLVTIVVVLPAALVSGFQFPQLIALLGRGGASVGRHVGLAYAWNTAGAITGSLAGGFGLLPLLTAPGAWRLVVVVLAALAVVAAALSARRGARAAAGPALVAAAASMALLSWSLGPTAAWRHSAIGAGRVDSVPRDGSRAALRDWVQTQRRAIAWEAEGRETSVGLSTHSGAAFMINGKGDGHARGDAATQVVGGLLGALVVEAPRRALVIGLGTGSTAGWLAAVPSVERVDVVELEPAVLRVARDCEAVNHGALDNPKVRVFIGDAREVLLTTRERYDVIFSEPSNPYRAGISSLFTQEFYRAAEARLSPGGVFVQWVQAYEIDGRSLRGAYATLSSVFDQVDTFRTRQHDLVLLARREPLAPEASSLRARIAQEPYRSALLHAFRATTLEGVLAHYVLSPALARAIAKREGAGAINTDDENHLEFALARTVGRKKLIDAEEIIAAARARHEDRPALSGAVDWDAVDEQRLSLYAAEGRAPAPVPAGASADLRARHEALARYARGELQGALEAFRAQPRAPTTLVETELLAEALAQEGRDEAGAQHEIDALRGYEPTEADAILARLRLRQGRLVEATAALESAFVSYRRDPWPHAHVMSRALPLTVEIAGADRVLGGRLFEALREPFAVSMLNDERLLTRVTLAFRVDARRRCVDALEPFEPNVPWRRTFLVDRMTCYAGTHHARVAEARRDLLEFIEEEGVRLVEPEP